MLSCEVLVAEKDVARHHAKQRRITLEILPIGNNSMQR